MLYSYWYSCACCGCKAYLTIFWGPWISVSLLGLQECQEVLLKMHGKLLYTSMAKDWLCWIVMNMKEIVLENWWQINLRILYVKKKPWVLKYKRNKQNHAVISVSCEKQSKSHSTGELMIMRIGWQWVSLFSVDPLYHSKANEQCGHHDKAEMLNGLAAWTSKAVRQLSVKSANKSPKLNPQLTL